MGTRLRRKLRNSECPKGPSKYQAKQSAGRQSYDVEDSGEQEVINSPSESARVQRPSLPTEMVETEGGINVRINYLPNPVAVQAVPYTKPREVYSFLIKSEIGRYSIKQDGLYEQGRGQVSSVNTKFTDLYRATSWLTTQGTIELDAIKEALAKKRESVEKHLGLELQLY